MARESTSDTALHAAVRVINRDSATITRLEAEVARLTAAIAAYEATRPAVSDEELLVAIGTGMESVAKNIPPGTVLVKGHVEMLAIAAMRAVRERLEP